MYVTVVYHMVYICPYMASFQEISRNSANRKGKSKKETTAHVCYNSNVHYHLLGSGRN